MYLSTCAQGNSIYAICGFGVDENTDQKTSLDTIECLHEASREEEYLEKKEWQVILMHQVLSARNSPIACPLNSEEIAICGGYNGNIWYGDMIIYNTRNNQAKKVVESDG